MSNKYFPALIIAAGGTGIKVGRNLQSLADSGLDDDLKQRLDNGSIQIVGIDTDKKSNDEVTAIDPFLLDGKDTPEGEREKIPSRLSRLPRNWLHLDRASLNHAIERVHEVISPGDVPHDEEQKFHEPLATIRRWFPLKNEKTGDQITKGHSKLSGAAQWRPLGRLSLFLNAQRIFETLHRAFKIVQQSDPEKGPVRAYIVCSLAGGTGSGMFWDLAFMLQMIDPSTQTSGMFLLGDPFEGVDEAGRIYPNIYAALKEIATFKNWREPLSVKYPISRGRTFKGQAQGALAFDMVYLYQSFPPGPDITDVAKGTIEATCYRMAQNLLSLQRVDVHAELDVGANNIDSDATSMTSQLESTYCFSTTGATMFHMQDPDEIANYIRYQLIRAVRPERYEKPNPLNKDELAAMLPEGSLAADTLQGFRNGLLSQTEEEGPELLSEKLRKFDAATTEDEQDKPSSVKEVFDALGDELREQLDKVLKSGEDKLSLGSVDDEIRQRFEAAMADLVERLKESVERVKKTDRPLDAEAARAVEAFKQELDKELPASDEEQTIEIKVKAPEGAAKIRNVQKETQEKPLADLSLWEKLINSFWDWLGRRNWSNDFNYRELRRYLGDLKQNVDAQAKLTRKKIEPVLNRVWNRYRVEMQRLLDDLLGNSRSILDVSVVRMSEDEKIQAAFEIPIRTELNFSKDQMNELLRSILPPTDDLDQWLEEHTDGVLSALKKHYPDQSRQDTFVPQIEPKQVRQALEVLARDLRQQFLSNPNQLSPQLLVHFIKQCLPEIDFDSGESARQKILTAGDAAREVVRYWSNLGNLILQQAGGEDALRKRLLRCKSKLFASGIIENKLNKKHLAVLPFSKSSRHYTDQDKKRIKETFDVVSQEVMHTSSVVIYETTESPIIFFNDLFRSAEEIERIRDYYNSYSSYSEDGNTTFFHIDRGMAGISDIVGDAIEVQPVRCGNPTCTADLRMTPRTLLVCPGCSKPIWNRCGNRKCYADNLREQIQETFTSKGKQRFPYDCPVCDNELKTYWWKCPDPDHAKKIPADKETCPQCLIEFQLGKRNHKEVHRRPDLRDLECPGCIHLEPDSDHRIKIPHALAPFYEKGVNGHDSLHFRELVEKYHADPKYGVNAHHCANSSEEHFLFPTCPRDRGNKDKVHHLYENDAGRFVCTRHPDLRFFECNYCRYPLEEGVNYTNGCPRCLRPVKHCDFCSEKFNRLYTPIKDSDPARCPNCTNLMQRNEMIDQEETMSGLDEPAFCANLFSCPAGSQPWVTSSDYHLEECRSCSEPVSPLMPKSDLKQLVDDCPLCSLVLSPIPVNGKKEYLSGKMIGDKFIVGLSTDQPINLDRICIICGSQTGYILNWMLQDGYLLNEKHPRQEVIKTEPEKLPKKLDTSVLKSALEEHPYKKPELYFHDALEMLTIFREEPDDYKAFLKLKRALGLEALLSTDPHHQESLLDAFEKGSRAGLTLRKRMASLWQYQQELKTRTQQWVRKPDRK
ncbi:MAG: tubulin-like doman-containing protein [Acidobacteriota bacterium]|nr:tubulin-like doman-containing protein [Acidobacteriota bacterium]